MEIEITKMTSRGQVVIPQEIREKEGLKEGERFIVVDINGNIVLKRVKNLGAKNIEDFESHFRALWKEAEVKGITEDDVQKEIEAYRKEKHDKNNR